MSAAALPTQSATSPLVRRGRPPGRPRRALARARRDGDQAARLRDLGGDPAGARRPHQGDRPREPLLPAARARVGARAGGRARRGIRARGRRRHPRGRQAARGAAGGATDLGSDDLVDLRELDPVLPRPAAALQPVGEHRPLGAAAAALPAHDGVPLAGGAHGARDGGRGDRGGADDPARRLRRRDRERDRDPGAEGTQERERALPGRRRDLHARGADARRKGAAGGDLALPRPRLRAHLRRPLRRPRRQRALPVRDLLGHDDAPRRRRRHGARRRPRAAAAAARRAAAGRDRADLQGRRARGRARGRRGDRRRAARGGLRVRVDDRPEHRPGLQVQRLGAEGRAAASRARPRDLAAGAATPVRRDTGAKAQIPLARAAGDAALLDAMQASLFERAGAGTADAPDPTATTSWWSTSRAAGFAAAPWCGPADARRG